MKSWDKQRFIIKHGILEWGIPVAIIYAFIITLQEKDLNKLIFISDYFLINIAISCIAFSIGGYFFGYFMWKIRKKKPDKIE
ncbi:peptidylprolyl isomerase [Clostridium bovifaecis]|uniref:Peptidylprolyl isomerase n=1 Tax=Clostridium bovifaecis TaxID=2184719 RepID=A0A6I6F530_9CLOT|nr:peptidylprolyl isomerase [Clostridium bovifaecis]